MAPGSREGKGERMQNIQKDEEKNFKQLQMRRKETNKGAEFQKQKKRWAVNFGGGRLALRWCTRYFHALHLHALFPRT